MNEDEEATLELMQSPVTSVTVVFTHFEITMYIRTLPASYKGDFCWGDEANFFLWQNPTRI